MSKFTLGRRALLRGASGVAVGLPYLEIMGEGTARAATPARRLVLVYAGVSLNVDDGGGVRFFAPKNAGPNYDLPPDLSPLGKIDRKGQVRTFKGYDIQNDVTVVSGLKIPWASNGGSPPPDGRPAQFHYNTVSPLLSGTTSWRGPSAENIVGRALGTGARFRALQLQIQSSCFEPGSNRADLSYDTDSAGNVVRKSFTASPQAAFQSIFRGVTLPTALTPEQKLAQKHAQEVLINRQKSLLDLVLRRADRLKARMGRTDLVRLERHFDEIRALEKRVTETPDLSGKPLCKAPADPGPDPAGSDYVISMNQGAIESGGWSQEDQRGAVMRDLMHMALTCDLTRAGLLQITAAQSFLNAETICGVKDNVHNCGHRPVAKREFDDVLAWHVDHFASLARKLKDTPDVDGSSMLDNTVIILATEGGGGYDAELGNYGVNNAGSAHSSENMALLVAGGRKLGLKPGRHLPQNNMTHPASVIRTAMRAVGVDTPLGAVSSDLPDL